MISPHFIPAYSVCHPSTNSASASGISKGARSDSAVAQMKNVMNPMNWGMMYYMVSFWA